MDSPGVTNHEGKTTGIYQSLLYFGLQVRDRFFNKVTEGPKPEIQIIETSSESMLSGTFAIIFGEQKVKISSNTVPLLVENALMSLPDIISVYATSNSAKTPIHDVTIMATKGIDIVFSSRRLYEFLIGDWARIGNQSNGQIFNIIEMSVMEPYSLRLSHPYLGQYENNATIFFHKQDPAIFGFQYIISFNCDMGSIAPLKTDISSLSGLNAQASVTSCDRFQQQTLIIKSVTGDTLHGSFYLTYKEEKTDDLSIYVTTSDLKKIIETRFTTIHSVTVFVIQNDAARKQWNLRFDSFEDKLDLLFVEGNLLNSGTAHSSIIKANMLEHCPVASLNHSLREVDSQAGSIRDDFAVTLVGPTEVYGDVVHDKNGFYSVFIRHQELESI